MSFNKTPAVFRMGVAFALPTAGGLMMQQDRPPVTQDTQIVISQAQAQVRVIKTHGKGFVKAIDQRIGLAAHQIGRAHV